MTNAKNAVSCVRRLAKSVAIAFHQEGFWSIKFHGLLLISQGSRIEAF